MAKAKNEDRMEVWCPGNPASNPSQSNGRVRGLKCSDTSLEALAVSLKPRQPFDENLYPGILFSTILA